MRAICFLVVAACSASRVPAVRFANAPAVAVVDDRRDVRVPPSERVGYRLLFHYDGTFHRRISRALALEGRQRARGVNAFDEVPDSTWFTNRIGARDLSLEELRRGATTIENPELHTPWTILKTKVGGAATGFIIRDARGEKFVLKLERRGYPELETATDVIVSRLLWAIGYNVPEDFVVYVHPRDLVLAPDAKIEDIFGNKHHLTARELAKRLASCDFGADGSLRGLASRFIPGKLLGGHASEGRRIDDPNDRIPHELRRDLRGTYPIFAWLDHIDVKETNTLDTWIADPARPSHHYVMHYLIDFGKSFGVMATMGRDLRRGHAYLIDFREIARSLITIGVQDRTWEHRSAPAIRGVGLFDASSYDPGAWKPTTPGYVPLLVADARDKFWGAKLVMRFTPAQIRAIVETGRFTDPRATEYITQTLIARQRATALHWFERTSSLDRFRIDGDRLCFDDLTIAYELAPVAGETRYFVSRFDRRGEPIASRAELHPGPIGRTCIPAGITRHADGYTIIEIVTARRDRSHAIYIHLARDPNGRARLIGIWRR